MWKITFAYNYYKNNFMIRYYPIFNIQLLVRNISIIMIHAIDNYYELTVNKNIIIFTIRRFPSL